MNGRILNVQRFCTEDGPGIRTTVFLKGCPMRCVWCHNPESQACEFELDYGYFSSHEEILKEILKDKVFYEASGGGVTVSGGEPLYQPDFTRTLLSACRENGIHTAIETGGAATEKIFGSVVQFCDLVLYDVKETDEERHERFTGVSSVLVLQNLRLLNDRKIPFIIRAPIIPSLNDRSSHFEALKALRDSMEFCKGIQIMPYHKTGAYKYERLNRPYACKDIEEPTKETVELWKQAVQ